MTLRRSVSSRTLFSLLLLTASAACSGPREPMPVLRRPMLQARACADAPSSPESCADPSAEVVTSLPEVEPIDGAESEKSAPQDVGSERRDS